jgi:glycosyltransferase involved in cell wall biosynthesis
VIVAHDWLCGLRGGELVLDRILTLLKGKAEVVGLYVMFADGAPMTSAIDDVKKTVARIGRVPGASTIFRRWLLPLYPSMVAELSRKLEKQHAKSPIDLVISTSSAAIKGLRPPPGVPHVCYIHAPARYIWNQAEAYTSDGSLRAMGLKRYRERFREWDKATAANVTTFIANSTHTKEQVHLCYERDAIVVHPPVKTDYFTPSPGIVNRTGDWLIVSALEPYKRIDLAIAAANKANHPLVIVGDGSQKPRLESIAGSTVRFMGRISKERLRHLYRTSRLLLFPQVEDFGIAAVEALACGLPVVARKEGGALDIVTQGVTGCMFEGDDVAAVLCAIEECPKGCDQACRSAAERFAPENFDRAFLGALPNIADAPIIPS